MKTRILSMVLAAVVFSTGCSTMKSRFGKLPKLPSSLASKSESTEKAEPGESKLPEYKVPEEMLAIWKDSVRTEFGEPSMRGIGGRLYLYDKDGAPIRAEGDLVIYGFDDSVKDREGSKADKRIVLENHDLQKLYSESALGPSYSVWIDWDEVGGPDKSVTLVPFFRTPEGKIVKAGQTVYTLHTPGKEKLFKEKLASHEENSEEETQGFVSHANYIQSRGRKGTIGLAGGAQAMSRSRSNLRTTTIALPQETQERLKNSNFSGTSNAANEANSKLISDSKPSGQVSRVEEARKKRREQIEKGNVFGMPGQL